MNCIATFDIGTTAIKGVLIGMDNTIIRAESRRIDTFFHNEKGEQDPNSWYTAFCEISNLFVRTKPQHKIEAIIMSGQMQNLIPIQKNGDPSSNAILYSDGRANREAEKISAALGKETIRKITGNRLDGATPFAKLLWLKDMSPDVFNQTDCVLFSSKDFIIRKLTGNCVTDITTGSTTGLMNILSKEWQVEWINRFGFSSSLLPKVTSSDEIVGEVIESASIETGYSSGTLVFSGSGDAGSATLAGAVIAANDFNINIGTTGWIATASEKPLDNPSVFNLAAIPSQTYINVVPFLNAGNVHQWISKILSSQERAINYDEVHRLLLDGTPGSNGLLFLPYIIGERFPVMNNSVRGLFAGISASTSKTDLAQAALEGVAFSIRQGLETINKSVQKMTVVGGGTKEMCWMKILSNILNQELIVFSNADFLPAIALSVSGKIGLGKEKNCAGFIEYLTDSCPAERYTPDNKLTSMYEERFRQFLKLYPLATQLG